MAIDSKLVASSKQLVAKQEFARRSLSATGYRLPVCPRAKRLATNSSPLGGLPATGFTLIELMVVMGIVAVVTAVVLANNSKYGGSVLLQNLAYDIALSVRQAQVYGISVRGSSGNFSVGYGMHFAMNDNIHYELFADKNGNGLFNADIDPALDENVPPSPYVIGRNYKIKSLCATGTNANELCNFNTLDIIFKRPEPDAHITARNGLGQSCTQNPNKCEEKARIIVISPQGQEKSIVVDASGQIAVQ